MSGPRHHSRRKKRKLTPLIVWPAPDGGLHIYAQPAPLVMPLAQFKEPEMVPYGAFADPYLLWHLRAHEVRDLLRWLGEKRTAAGYRLLAALREHVLANDPVHRAARHP